MTEQTSQPAKVTRPYASKTFLRKRLFRLLDAATLAKAVWVLGPPGSGKTTLINSYVEAKRLNCLWYQADEGDKDPATFFHFLSMGAQGLYGKKQKPLPHFTPEYRLGLPAFSRVWFNEFFSRVKRPFVLVIDNYHEIPPDSKTHEILSVALGALPKGCSMIFVSRAAAPREFARLIANREMRLLGWDDLKLLDVEAKGIAKVWGHKTANDIKALLQRAQGWTAGLLLLLERAQPVNGAASAAKPSDTLFNYFMSEIFDETDAATTEFLLSTSFLPSMTAAMAAHISGNPDAPEILSSLNSKNFFVEKRAGAHANFQYHPLFKDFLTSRAKARFEASDITGIQNQAAEILSKAGRIEDAAHLYVEAKNWKGLTGLITGNALALIGQGRYNVLGAWLDAMPAGVLDSDAWLKYYLGVCRLPFDPASARLALEDAFNLFKKKEDPAGIFLSWSGVVNGFIFEMNDFHPMDFWIAEFERLVERYKTFPSPAVEEQAVSCMFNALMNRCPQHPDIVKWKDRAEAVMRAAQNKPLKMTIGYNLTLFYLRTCQIPEAGVLVDSMSKDYKSPDAPPLERLTVVRARALYHFYVSLHAESHKNVEEALKIAEDTGIHIFDSVLWGTDIYNAHSTGDLTRAERLLDKMSTLTKSPRLFDRIYYHHMASMVSVLKGDLPKAVEHGKTCVALSEKLGAPFLHYIHLYGYIYALVEANPENEISPFTDEMREFGRKVNSGIYYYSSLLTEAMQAMRLGNDTVFFDRITKFVSIAKTTGIRVVPFIKPSSCIPICAKAIEAGCETEYMRELIRLNYYIPTGPMPQCEAWPWQLKIYTLGRLDLSKDTERVRFPKKGQGKALALLKALVALGGRDVPMERISDALWPDADGDTASASLYTTIHRLKKLIQSEDVIIVGDGRVSLDGRLCWTDVSAVEFFLAGAEEKRLRNDKDNAVALIEKAAALYKGHFLSTESENDLYAPLRERLRLKFSNSLDAAGKCREESGDHAKALEFYRRGVEIDELSEVYYRKLMKTHALLGNRAEAIKLYNRLKRLLSNVLNIEPSAETQKVYKNLLA
ncbi:MAG: hypothetical protein HY884_02380 [Deltaproteobacteria bacterium]|nr:hypothetical protein [Deltaproteobacteria bacterium]